VVAVGRLFSGGVDVEPVEEVGVADGLQGFSVDGDVTDGQTDLLLVYFIKSFEHSHQLRFGDAVVPVLHLLELLLKLTAVLRHEFRNLIERSFLLIFIYQLKVFNERP
jgi:hypothetical protein